MKKNQFVRIDIKTDNKDVIKELKDFESKNDLCLNEVIFSVDEFLYIYENNMHEYYNDTEVKLLNNIDLENYDKQTDFSNLIATGNFNCSNSKIIKFPRIVGGRFSCSGIDLSNPDLVFPIKMKEFLYFDSQKNFSDLYDVIPNGIENKIILDDSLFDKQRYIQGTEYTNIYYDALKFMSRYDNLEIVSKDGVRLNKFITKIQKNMEKNIAVKNTTSVEFITKDETSIQEFINLLKNHKKFKKYKLEKYKQEELINFIKQGIIEYTSIKIKNRKDYNNNLHDCFLKENTDVVISALINYMDKKIQTEKNNKRLIKTSEYMDNNDIFDALKKYGYMKIYKESVIKSIIKKFLSENGQVLYNDKNEKIKCISVEKYKILDIKTFIKSCVDIEINNYTEKTGNLLDRNDILHICRSEKNKSKYEMYSDEQLKKFIRQVLNNNKNIKQYETVHGKCICVDRLVDILNILDSYLKTLQDREKKQPESSIKTPEKIHEIPNKEKEIIEENIYIEKYIPKRVYNKISSLEEMPMVLDRLDSLNIDFSELHKQNASILLNGKICSGLKWKRPDCITSSFKDNVQDSRRLVIRQIYNINKEPIYICTEYFSSHTGSKKITEDYKATWNEKLGDDILQVIKDTNNYITLRKLRQNGYKWEK